MLSVNLKFSLKTLCAICAIFTNSAFSQKAIYQLEDLKILASQNNYREFFDHAKDLPPRKRDKAWEQMVENQATGYLQQLISSHDLPKKDLERIKSLSLWPIFITNEFFISKRDNVFLKAMNLCQENCHQQADLLFKNFNHSQNFEFHFLSIVTKYNYPHRKKWKIVETFVQSRFSQFYCHREVLKKLVINQIHIDVNTHGKIKNLIHPDCLKQLLPALKKNLASNDVFKNKKGSFLALKSMSKLDPLRKNLYLIEQFLQIENLNNKEIDESLGSLTAVSLDHTLRELVLKKLTHYDPLPGKLFLRTNKSGIGRIRILARKFPELIDLYAKRCLSYLTGEISFPKGNPTPECHELFKLSKILEILPKSFIKKYGHATRFLNKSL
jgi:hypothetical protein